MKKIVKITLSVILCMSLIVGCGKKKEEEKTIVEFRIHVIKEDKEIANLPGYVGSVIKAGEEKILTTTYGMDLTKATKIEYEIVR